MFTILHTITLRAPSSAIPTRDTHRVRFCAPSRNHYRRATRIFAHHYRRLRHAQPFPSRATYRRAKRIAHDLALYYALPSRATASRTTLRIARDIALPLRDIITHSADFTRTPTETWKEARRRSMTAYQIRKSTTNTSSEYVLECTRNTLRLVCKLAHVCATYYSFYRSR